MNISKSFQPFQSLSVQFRSNADLEVPQCPYYQSSGHSVLLVASLLNKQSVQRNKVKEHYIYISIMVGYNSIIHIYYTLYISNKYSETSQQQTSQIADMSLIADETLSLKWTIFFKLPPNSGHLSITDIFLRLVSVRYSEVSLYIKYYICIYYILLEYIIPEYVYIDSETSEQLTLTGPKTIVRY